VRAVEIHRLLGRALKGLLYLRAGRREPLAVPVLTYHSVDRTGSLLSVTPAELRCHLEVLRAGGWRGLTLGKFMDRVHGQFGSGREVFVTFDDGYENFYTEAAPVLAALDFPATVFVVTDYMGARPIWYERDRRSIDRFLAGLPFSRDERGRLATAMSELGATRLMDWAQARELLRHGIDVQSHSATHPFLTSLDPEALAADLLRSRRAIEDGVGVPAQLLCYPYGDCDVRVAAAARHAGYKAGVLAEHTGPWPDPFRIGRIGISGETRPFELRFSLSSAAEDYARLRRWVAARVGSPVNHDGIRPSAS
jgi:peptidoglycan/xylan/chitin deacetylase (PgdA/CDA1 family)